MNLSLSFFKSPVPFAPVYQDASAVGLCCPACGQNQDTLMQQLQPCKHLVCVYDHDQQTFSYQSDDFKQRVKTRHHDASQDLTAQDLAHLGYGDEMLAVDFTRGGCWSSELYAFDFSVD